MPRASSSAYSRRTRRSIREPGTRRPRSQKRMPRRSSSARWVHAGCFFTGRKRTRLPVGFPRPAELAAADLTGSCGCGSADSQQEVLEQLVGIGFDELALEQTLPPWSGDRSRTVESAGKLPAGGCGDVGIAAPVSRMEHGIPKAVGRRERLERDRQRLGGAAPEAAVDDRRDLENPRLRLPAERPKQGSREVTTSGQNGRRLAGGPGGVARELHRLLFRGEEEHDHRRDARERLRIALVGSVRAGEKLAPPLRSGEGAGGARGDAEALTRRGKVTLALPQAVTLDLVARVEAV